MAYETCEKHDNIYDEILDCTECCVQSSAWWAEELKKEREKLLDAMQAVCNKEKNEGGKMLIKQFRNV